MDNSDILLKIYEGIGIISILTEIFTGMQTSYLILLVLILMDTFTGISTAIKYKRFSSIGLRKSIRKIITYAISIITVRMLEIVLNPIVITTMLSRIIISFLAITEGVSILENLTLLGVPLPNNILNLLIKPIKIPILNNMLESSKDREKEFSGLNYIVNSQINNLDDKYIKSFLKIRYDEFKEVINQIMFIDDANNNPDILYYKVISFVELFLKNSSKKYLEKNIPPNYIECFSEKNNNTIFEFLTKLKITCYSENTIREKKEQLIDIIIVIVYQSIIDLNNCK
ncbi:phage holin family protein [Clostridium sp.]|jgi:toxin secretion/phage lysis holin|uniref:phage holin family protein n=1 Tax=Clostridium sp. TaxID=1506 RepID=UPI003EEE24A0